MQHTYHHPLIKPQAPLRPGTTVEHRNLPGVDLAVVSGPEAGLTGGIYRVRMPDGKEVKVKRKNLI